jgi:hypothetical protein
MHHLPGLPRFHDEGHLGPGLFADQVVVDRGQGQQAGDGGIVFLDPAVGEDQHRVPGLDRQGSAPAQPGQGPFEFPPPAADAEEHREGGGQEITPGKAAQFFEIVVGQDRVAELQGMAVPGGFLEEVALDPDEARERHHQLLPDRIDGGVGHLGELLLEVVEQQLGPVGQAGQRGVDPHRAHGLLSLGRHRREDPAELLVGVSELPLPLEDRCELGGVPPRRIGKVVDRRLVLPEPLRVGAPAGQPVLEFGVGDDASLLHVHEQHPAGLEPALEPGFLGPGGEHPRFRSHDHHVIARDDVAGGPQAVAVERRPDHAAVGEGDGRGPVPRFHQGGVVFVEGLFVRRHGVVPVPGLGHQHRHGVG